MEATFPLGRIGGVRLRVHLSLLLALPLFAWLAGRRMSVAVWASLLQSGGAAATVGTWAALLTVGLLGSIALHEGAHALAAIAVGARVPSVTLVALTGSTVAERIRSPGRKAIVAAAGPVVSLVAGGLLVAGARLRGLHLDARIALISLAQVQLVLGAIDLLPAPPLDGGQLVAALLERRWGRARASAMAGAVGRILAAAIALAALLRGQIAGITVAGLMWAGSDRFAAGAARSVELSGITVGELAAPAVWIDGAASLSEVAACMRREARAALVLSERGVIAGMVELCDVARVPPSERDATIARSIARAAPSVEPAFPALAALQLLRARRLRALPVVDGGALCGVVTADALDAACELGRLGDPPLEIRPRE